MAYAEKTSVPADRSQAEIRKILARYGAQQFVFGEKADQALIGFQANQRNVRFILPLPAQDGFRRTPTGRRRRGQGASAKAWDQEVKRLWRALALAIKAKLEVVQSGITTFEDEFMAHIVLPDGRTVSEHAAPMIEDAYSTGRVRGLLPEFTS